MQNDGRNEGNKRRHQPFLEFGSRDGGVEWNLPCNRFQDWSEYIIGNMANREWKKATYSYSVIYESAPEGGYAATVPALPGCHTQGETLEEAESNVKEAIEVYVESLLAHGEPVPQELRILQGKVEVQLS